MDIYLAFVLQEVYSYYTLTNVLIKDNRYFLI